MNAESTWDKFTMDKIHPVLKIFAYNLWQKKGKGNLEFLTVYICTHDHCCIPRYNLQMHIKDIMIIYNHF